MRMNKGYYAGALLVRLVRALKTFLLEDSLKEGTYLKNWKMML